MKTDTKPDTDQSLSMMVAGEDLRRGDFVATLTQIDEVPTYMWDHADFALSPHDLVRLKFIPRGAGQPLKIIGLSLPFVYVVAPDKTIETLDVRRTQLVRLAPRCAKAVWKQMKSRKKPRKR